MMNERCLRRFSNIINLKKKNPLFGFNFNEFFLAVTSVPRLPVANKIYIYIYIHSSLKSCFAYWVWLGTLLFLSFAKRLHFEFLLISSRLHRCISSDLSETISANLLKRWTKTGDLMRMIFNGDLIRQFFWEVSGQIFSRLMYFTHHWLFIHGQPEESIVFHVIQSSY